MKFDRTEPSATNQYQAAHVGLILDSYRQLLRHDLLPRSTNLEQLAQELYHAPFVVLAHDSAPDPVFGMVQNTAWFKNSVFSEHCSYKSVLWI